MRPWSVLASRWTWIILLFGGFVASARGDEQITRDLDRAANLVVSLEARIGDRAILGSGLVVGREREAVIVVTANHVVRQGTTTAQKILVRFKSAPEKQAPAVLLQNFDHDDDIAVLRVERMLERAVDPCRLPPPRFDEKLVVLRDHGVFPIGNPSGVAWRIPAAPDQVTDVNDRDIRFQSALIENGHSGGGLFNVFGDLIGMIKADQPPYGLAVRLERVAQRLRVWGYPFEGDAGTLRTDAGDKQIDAGIATRSTQPASDPCITETAPPRDQGSPQQNPRQSPSTSPEDWLYDDELYGHNEIWIPLFQAVQQGQVEEVYRIINSKGKEEVHRIINSEKLAGDWRRPPKPLHWAAAFGQVNVVKQLLLMGAPVNKWEGGYLPLLDKTINNEMATSLHIATRLEHLDVMQVLIRANADLEAGVARGTRLGTPLTLAARYGLVEPAKILIAAGADPQGGYGDGFDPVFPLGEAVAHGHIEMVKLLERSGAPLILERDASQLLGIASWHGQLEVMRYLISRGVPLECSSIFCTESEGPLSQALFADKTDAVQLLLQAGADPGGVDYKPYLQIAIERNNMRALQLLLKAGANPNVKNRNGESALRIALTHDNKAAVEILSAYGATK